VNYRNYHNFALFEIFQLSAVVVPLICSPAGTAQSGGHTAQQWEGMAAKLRHLLVELVAVKPWISAWPEWAADESANRVAAV